MVEKSQRRVTGGRPREPSGAGSPDLLLLPALEPGGIFLMWVAVGDFDGEGELDLVVTAIGLVLPEKQGGTSLLRGKNNGTFQPTTASRRYPREKRNQSWIVDTIPGIAGTEIEDVGQRVGVRFSAPSPPQTASHRCLSASNGSRRAARRAG